MKKSKIALLGVSALFLFFLGGMFVGRNTTGNIHSMPIASNVKVNTVEDSIPQENTEKGKIDINTANVVKLALLPGIGETLAQRIVDHRTDNGDFDTIDEIMLVSGIGESKFAQIKEYITVGG